MQQRHAFAEFVPMSAKNAKDIERLWDAKVFLELWVKVRSGWADSEVHLRSYGYE